MPPRTMQLLTYAGSVPFIISALGLVLGWQAITLSDWIELSWPPLLLTYSAIILSFLAGIHWGLALRESNANHAFRLAMHSNVIALLAWLALLITSLGASLLLLLCCFVWMACVDAKLAVRLQLPSWYRTLRLRISTIVVVCLLVALVSF